MLSMLQDHVDRLPARVPQAGDGAVSRRRSRTCRRAGAGASSSRATPTAASAASPATSARSPARSTASRCRRPRTSTGRRYPEFFRINFSRCIFCGFCEEACPTYAIQLTPDFEMSEYDRQNLVYEKEDLLISGPGKYPGYNFYRVAGRGDRRQGQGRGARTRSRRWMCGACCREAAYGRSPSTSRRAVAIVATVMVITRLQRRARAALPDRLAAGGGAWSSSRSARRSSPPSRSSSTPAPSWCCSSSWS